MTFDGRQPLTEDDLWRKTTFDGRRPLTKDDLWQKTTFDRRHLWRKTTFDGRGPLTEDELWRKMTFDGRWPLREDDFWWKTTFDRVYSILPEKYSWLFTRGVQNSEKFDSVLALWFFPLYILSGVTKKFFSLLACFEQPPQTYFRIQRIFQKIQRKKYIFTIFIFSAFKPVSMMIWGVWLHSWGPDAFFDTHIDLFVNNKCGIQPASKVAFMAFLT